MSYRKNLHARVTTEMFSERDSLEDKITVASPSKMEKIKRERLELG